jgi:hypothetical protein
MPYEPKTAAKPVEVTGVPPGKARLTVSVRLLGLIPLRNVKVTVDGFEVYTGADGTAFLDLDVGRGYEGRAEHLLMDTASFKIDKLEKDAAVVVRAIPSLLVWTIGSASASGLAYLTTGDLKKTAATGVGLELVWVALKRFYKPVRLAS